MGVGNWVVDDYELNAVPLTVDQTFISTGAATIEYFVQDDTGRQYLQSDETTFAATYAIIPCSFDAKTGFGHLLKVPSSMLGKTVAYLIRHSVYGIISGSSNHAVVASGGAGGLTVKLKP